MIGRRCVSLRCHQHKGQDGGRGEGGGGTASRGGSSAGAYEKWLEREEKRKTLGWSFDKRQ